MSQYSNNGHGMLIKSEKNEKPLMVTYEQRHKSNSSMLKDFTEPTKLLTLDEKIRKREEEASSIEEKATDSRIKVEINGTRYLLGASDELSPSKILKIANLANKIVEEAKEENPGLTNSKLMLLALLDASEMIIDQAIEIDNMKTDLLYYKRKDIINTQSKPVEPTFIEQSIEQN